MSCTITGVYSPKVIFSTFSSIFFAHFMILSSYQLHPTELNTARKITKKRIKSERTNRPTVNVPDALSGRQG